MTIDGERFDWEAIRRRLYGGAADRDREQIARRLRMRAERLAVPPPAPAESASRTAMLVVRVASERLALPAAEVVEVARLGRVTPLPGRPDRMVGVTSLRGEPCCVVDLRLLLGLAAESRTAGVGLVLRGRLSGVVLVVDEALGLERLGLDLPPGDGGEGAPLARYVARRTPDGVGLLDLAAVAAHEVFTRPARSRAAPVPAHDRPPARETLAEHDGGR